MANELGAGNLVAAKASAFVAIMIAAVESSSVSFALFMSSNVWGYAYSNVPEVIHYAAEITPVLCISIVMDSLSASLTGQRSIFSLVFINTKKRDFLYKCLIYFGVCVCDFVF